MRKTADMLDVCAARSSARIKWHSQLEPEGARRADGRRDVDDRRRGDRQRIRDRQGRGLKAAASIDRRALNALKVPDRFKARVSAFVQPPPTPIPAPKAAEAATIVSLCQDAGLDLSFANALLAQNLTDDAALARIATEKDTRARAKQRDTDIRAACQIAGRADLADDYVRGGMDLAAVRAQLLTIKAVLDKAAIDTGLKPDHQGAAAHSVDVLGSYTALNTGAQKGQ
jgi:hypothetical protein